MGRFITAFLMVISLIFSPLQGLSPIGISLFNSNMDKGTGQSIDLPTVGQQTQSQIEVEDPTQTDTESTNKYKTSSFITLDFEGYCTIQVPESHFTLRASSDSVLKELGYKDNKTRLTMSYVTHIGSDADIPGYITREVAGVETTTNNKVVETYGNNQEWMKVPAEDRVDGCNIYVYYTLNESKSSAFWVKAKVAPDSDGDEFYDVLRQIFDTYQTYGGSGTLFETPDTGIYEGMDQEDKTHGDTSQYQANNDLANQVFASRGGYIPGADISANWEDLEIILDGHKFQLPCYIDDFYDAGFEVNDRKVTADHMNVEAGKTLDVVMQNDNGTVITTTFYNSSLKMAQSADDCMIMRIIVDSDAFINVTDAEREARQREKEEASAKYEEQKDEKTKQEEEAKQKAEEEANRQWVLPTTNVNIREKANTDCKVLKKAQIGEKYEYIRMSDDGTWYVVKYEGGEAYIKSTYATLVKGDAAAEEKLKELSSGVEPSDTEQSESAGTESSSTEQSDESGADSSEQTESTKKQVIKITKSVPLKEEPQGNAKKITALSRGETFDYLGVSDDALWYKIDYFGTEAWVNAVAADLVEMDEEQYAKAQDNMNELYGVESEEEAEKEALEKAANADENTPTGEIDYTSEEFDASYDNYGHQMILAGGVTWPAYADDIVSYYGTGVSRTNYNNGQNLMLKWTRGDKYMKIETGQIKDIYSVEISCVPSN